MRRSCSRSRPFRSRRPSARSPASPPTASPSRRSGSRSTGSSRGVSLACYYWPSFEIVRWVGAHLDWPAYGVPDGVTSHASRYLVAAIIESFTESFYVPEAVADMRSRRPQAPEPAPWSLRGRLLRLRYERRAEASRLQALAAGEGGRPADQAGQAEHAPVVACSVRPGSRRSALLAALPRSSVTTC